MVGRDPTEEHRASTPLECLFDLCFVVAVSQTAAQLHHRVISGEVDPFLIVGYLGAFFAIWWAWMNFTWFASAYDTDDVPYRLLTLVQIAGGLIIAAGVPAAMNGNDFTTVTIGYVVMRIALVAQWLRAASEHKAGRARALRYAIGVSAVQVGWVARLALPGVWASLSQAVLVVLELAVPVWAHGAGEAMPFHPGHIAERYGLFTLIVLGESVLATTIALQQVVQATGLSLELAETASGGLLLLFCMWWSYFNWSAAQGLRLSTRTAFMWGYGHFIIFSALAALGAGLQVAADFAQHNATIPASWAALAVAIPAGVYLVVLSWLHAVLDHDLPFGPWIVFVTVALMLAVAAATGVWLSLRVALLIMPLLVAISIFLKWRQSLPFADRRSHARRGAG